MERTKISGILKKPDGTEEYWWNGVNYHNILPEELMDEFIKYDKLKEEQKNARKRMSICNTINDN